LRVDDRIHRDVFLGVHPRHAQPSMRFSQIRPMASRHFGNADHEVGANAEQSSSADAYLGATASSTSASEGTRTGCPAQIVEKVLLASENRLLGGEIV
jgi:hypothetical protein